jgi:SEL1 protein
LNPKRAYDTFSVVAARTGSPSAQAFLGFFHATGYGDVVPSDQAKAQLYFTFAANGGDKSAQMSLAYRYWSGIGTSDSCKSANAWYGSAAEQGSFNVIALVCSLIIFYSPAMIKFMSGPPGGKTLPQTPTRLSDLTGGIYGPGASVASSGFGAQRPAIKAGVVRAAGETWEDVLDYYMVRFPVTLPPDSLADFSSSSMLTEARLTLLTV